MQDNPSGLLTCVTCGKLYKGCRTCEESRHRGQFMWRQSCDRKECFLVHMVLKDYFDKKITKEQAREQLLGCLDDDMKPYNENAREIIAEILKEEKPVVETKKKFNVK